MPKAGCSSYSLSSMPGHILKINWGRPALQWVLSVCRGRAGSTGEFLSLALRSCRPRALSKLKNNMAKGQVPPFAVLTRMTSLFCPARPLPLQMKCSTVTRLILRCVRLKEFSFLRTFLYASRLSCAQLPTGTPLPAPKLYQQKGLGQTSLRPSLAGSAEFIWVTLTV